MPKETGCHAVSGCEGAANSDKQAKEGSDLTKGYWERLAFVRFNRPHAPVAELWAVWY